MTLAAAIAKSTVLERIFVYHACECDEMRKGKRKRKPRAIVMEREENRERECRQRSCKKDNGRARGIDFISCE
jgi:hypothetical protein